MTPFARPMFLAFALLLAASGTASAQIVDIDARVSGCASVAPCSAAHLPPGQFIGNLINPVQLTLEAGSYSITNASLAPGANPAFSAWRYNSGSNWVWSFMIVDDATKRVLVQGCCGNVFASQAGAADQPFAQTYFATLTLPAKTTLDFVIEDYQLNDNAGGISLKIQPIPEPGTFALLLAGIVGVAAVARRRGTAAGGLPPVVDRAH